MKIRCSFKRKYTFLVTCAGMSNIGEVSAQIIATTRKYKKCSVKVLNDVTVGAAKRIGKSKDAVIIKGFWRI